ncbi:MAG: glutathione peroxidase [Sphingomonadales bacterium]
MATPASAHEFTFTSIDGKDMSLGDFAGKAVLVVNTASECGYTPQYDGLQTLWENRKDDGLIVLGVPSNDFGGQEPGSEEDIKSFCEVRFGVNFPMTEKAVVKGKDAHPFYQWAASTYGEAAEPRWNFHKILVGPDGTVVGAYASGVTPADKKLGADIDAAIASGR